MDKDSECASSGDSKPKQIGYQKGDRIIPFESCGACLLCYNLLFQECEACEEQEINKDGCPIALGKCGHRFHGHCIERSLSSDPLCPTDQEMWVYDN